MIRILFIALIMTTFCPLAKSQLNYSLPIDFDQVESAIQYKNPSHFDENRKLTGLLGYNGFNSLSPNIRSFYADITFQKNTKEGGHIWGVQTFSDQEGKFIAQNRAYLKYAYYLHFNSAFKGAFGAGFGFINLGIADNDVVTSYNDTKPDFKIGISLQHTNWFIESAILQLIDAKLTVINGELIFKRYLVNYGGYRWKLSPTLSLETSGYARIAKTYYPDLRLINRIILNEMAYGSISGNLSNGFVFGAGINQLKIQNGQISFGISYRVILTGTERVGSNKIELSLQYDILEKPEKEVTN